jgi:transposase
VSILSTGPDPNTPDPRFYDPPWHDDHPNKCDIERRLEPDHRARLIDEAVGRLDLSALRHSYGGTGSQAHPPEQLLRAVLYEVRNGYHSPAQWYRHARENEPVRWLLRGCEVARSCWYEFRDRLQPLLLELNQQPLVEAVEGDLTPATRGALDGTLIAANASRHKVVTQATLHKRLEQLLAACAADAPQPAAAEAGLATEAPAGSPPAAAEVAATPAAAPPTPPAWMATSVAGRQHQCERLQRTQTRMQQLQANNLKKWASKQKAAQAIWVSPSDPDAAVGRDKEKVFRPLYNVQVLDDLDSPLILAYDVLGQQSDAGLLGPMLALAQRQLGHALEAMLADTSYADGTDLAAAKAGGVTLYAPVPVDAVAAPKQIPKREFAWLEGEQTYVCPQGHRLEFEQSWKEKRVGGAIRVWRYRCPAEHCRSCPERARCTRTPEKGRVVTRQEHEELIEALRARMGTEEAKALYRLRGQNVELVNADWKEHRKLRRFSGRGLKRVHAEVGLEVLAHNLLAVQAMQKERPQRVGLPVITNPANNTT